MGSTIIQQIMGRCMRRINGIGGWGKAEYTHGRARGTLETGETTVTLYASVALFACLTLVTTGTLGSLDEKREQVVKWKVH